jgi:hypothetical protein
MAGGAGVYTGGGATVIMDPPPVVYVKVFHSGSGPDRSARANAQKVAIVARQTAPSKTGYMASQIYAEQNRNEHGRYAFGYRVVSPVYYSKYVHEGTGPSPRWPNPQHKVMHFHGSRGDMPYRDFVMHPGISAQPFLRDALAAAGG